MCIIHHYFFHEDWIWLGVEKDVYFISYESVDNELYTHGVSSKDELCDVHERGSSTGEGKERM